MRNSLRLRTCRHNGISWHQLASVYVVVFYSTTTQQPLASVWVTNHQPYKEAERETGGSLCAEDILHLQCTIVKLGNDLLSPKPTSVHFGDALLCRF